jgi:hypothetical protein
MIPEKSALDQYVTSEWSGTSGGYHEGRDGFHAHPNLFDKSLKAVEHTPQSRKILGADYHRQWSPQRKTILHPPAARIPIDVSGASSDPQSIPVKKWSSKKEMVELLRESIKHQEEQEKLDAYERAMSIL